MKQDRLPHQGLRSSYIYEKMCMKSGEDEPSKADPPQFPPKPNPSDIEKELRNILALETNEFICKSYRLLLGREADPDGFATNQRLLCGGMPRECLFYKLAASEEFGQRFAVADLQNYKKIYRHYRIRHILKRIPILSHLVYLITLPKRIQEMSLEYRKYQADLRELAQFHQANLKEQAQSHQRDIESLKWQITDLRQPTSSLRKEKQ